LEVTGSNILHKFTHASHFRNFEGKSPSDVIKGLADSYALKPEVEDFGASRDFLTEEGLSDYEYLLTTADAYGKHIFASGSALYVGNEISVRADEIVYEWGKSLVKFEGFQDISRLTSGVDCIGWDFLKNEPFTARASLPDIPVKIGGANDWTGVSKGGGGKFVETLINYSLKDADEAKQFAVGRLQGNSFLFGYAGGSGEGDYRLRPGMRVTIKMVGESFAGEYRAHAVKHSLNFQRGYTTGFILQRNMLP
jgi:phage protein D